MRDDAVICSGVTEPPGRGAMAINFVHTQSLTCIHTHQCTRFVSLTVFVKKKIKLIGAGVIYGNRLDLCCLLTFVTLLFGEKSNNTVDVRQQT